MYNNPKFYKIKSRNNSFRDYDLAIYSVFHYRLILPPDDIGIDILRDADGREILGADTLGADGLDILGDDTR
ncbi:MAG: hypothetical protein DRI44_08235 [Chlamydiae bacterium]|nr:MAG: hypothetical protein DRI44_08235 [Chlamydiota bacterium]